MKSQPLLNLGFAAGPVPDAKKPKLMHGSLLMKDNVSERGLSCCWILWRGFVSWEGVVCPVCFVSSVVCVLCGLCPLTVIFVPSG